MELRLENAIKRLTMYVLPQPILYELWHLRRKSRPRTGDDNAEELRAIPVQPDVRLEVYWNTNPLGPGPAASLYVLDEEVMRIDCFGGQTGHLHLNPVQANLALPWAKTPRFFFPPASMEDQVERGAFELRMNTSAALQTNQLARIRNFAIEKNHLNDAVDQMKVYMIELIASHPSGK
jgi:hypothetical protein